MGQDGRGYPSLAKRAIETEAAAASPQPDGSQAPISSDTSLTAQLADLSQQAEKGRAAFDALYAEAARRVRVATSAPVSSEQWVAANVDLGRLEQARYDSVFALASLDTLYADRMKAIAGGEAQGGVEEIETARAPVLAMVDAQNDRVDELRAVLKAP